MILLLGLDMLCLLLLLLLRGLVLQPDQQRNAISGSTGRCGLTLIDNGGSLGS